MQKVVFSIPAGAWLDLLLQGGKLPPKSHGSWCVLPRLWSRQVQGCPLGRRWGAGLVPGGTWSWGGQAKSYLGPLAEPPARHIHQSREGPAPTARYNPTCEWSTVPWGPARGFTLTALAVSERLAVGGDGKRLEYKYVKHNTDSGLRLTWAEALLNSCGLWQCHKWSVVLSSGPRGCCSRLCGCAALLPRRAVEHASS